MKIFLIRVIIVTLFFTSYFKTRALGENNLSNIYDFIEKYVYLQTKKTDLEVVNKTPNYFDGSKTLVSYYTDYLNKFEILETYRYMDFLVKDEYENSYSGSYDELIEMMREYNWSQKDIFIYEDLNPKSWNDNAQVYKHLSHNFKIDTKKIEGLTKEKQLLNFKGDVAAVIRRGPEALEFKNMHRSFEVYNLPNTKGTIYVDILEFDKTQDAFNRLFLEIYRKTVLFNEVNYTFPRIEGLGDYAFSYPFCFVRGNVMVIFNKHSLGIKLEEEYKGYYEKFEEESINLAKKIDKQILDYINCEN